jgi:hypothetical protein
MNDVWASIQAVRGNDPTKWFVAPKVIAAAAIRPTPTPQERLTQLKLVRARLESQMAADGFTFNLQGLVCVASPDGCNLDEDAATEIQDLGTC